jgi:hypothetical protein
MKRWLFNVAVVLSLLLSLAAAAAWAVSYAPPHEWRLLGIAHSADLARVEPHRRTAVSMLPAGSSTEVQHGFWDSLWALSGSGRLTLLAQAVDYNGTVRGVYAVPPSVTVELAGTSRARALAFGPISEPRPRKGLMGFAWEADAQRAVDSSDEGGSASVQARMITLPYWFIVLLGLTMPLLSGFILPRVAARRRERRDSGH